MSRWKFTPNVELIDDEGDSRGFYLRDGGACPFYTDEPTWHLGGKVVSQREIEAWGWTVRDLSASERMDALRACGGAL